MKIFAIFDNHVGADRRGAGSPQPPCWATVADSALLRNGKPVFLPEYDSCFEAYPSAVIRVGRLGKSIAPRFAARYIAQAAPGLSIRAMDTWHRLTRSGLPWSQSISFDGSALVGEFADIDNGILPEIRFTLGDIDYTWSPDCLAHGIGDILAALSEANTLKNGDLIYAGLPESGIRLTPGTDIRAWADGIQTLDFRIR